jgi:serine/threonine protein kinase
LQKLVEFYRGEGLFLTEDLVLSFTHQTLKGLAYIHSLNMIHRDIKPKFAFFRLDFSCYILTFHFKALRFFSSSNLFLKNNQVKIGDLGLACTKDGPGEDMDGGTFAYLSPEIITKQSYSDKSDMWLVCFFFNSPQLDVNLNVINK